MAQKLFTPYGDKSVDEIYTMKDGGSYNNKILDNTLTRANLPLQREGSAYVPTLAEAMAGKSFANPLFNSKPQTNVSVPNNVSVPIIDNSSAPIIKNDTSNIKTQTDTIAAQLAKIQAQVDAAKKAGYTGNEEIKIDAQGNPIPKNDTGTGTEPQKENMWDKLMGLFKQNQDQINNLPVVPTVEDTTNKILSTFGYTPESFKQVAGLNDELTSLSNQMVDLEKKKQQALDAIEARPEIDLQFMGKEQTRIQRLYATEEAALGAKSAVVTAKINALTGAWDKAQSAAKDYVTLATAERRQKISDIQYATSFYKDVYEKMDASDRQRVNDYLDYQVQMYNAEEKAAQNEINNELRRMTIQATQANSSILNQMRAEQMGLGQPIAGAGDLGDAFNRAISGTAFTTQDRTQYQRQFQNYINSGDTAGAIEFVKDLAISGMGTVAYKDYVNRQSAISNLQSIKDDLNAWVKAGGSTNILVGSFEKITNKLGATQNPKLAALAAKMKNSLIEYRRAATGVQFSMPEQQQYQQLFPDISKNLNFNDALMGGLISVMTNANDVMLQQRLGTKGMGAVKGGAGSIKLPSGVKDLSKFEQ